MRNTRRPALVFLSVAAILSLMLSLTGTAPASATPSTQTSGDGLSRDFNSETGRLTLISPSNNKPMRAVEALGVASLSGPQASDPARALAERFAPDFGLQSASQNLQQLKITQSDGGRKSVRYQQTYRGVPVLAGELVVNTDNQGNLYSINGEVSPNLSLSIAPKIASQEAKDTALGAVAKWYQKGIADLKASEPMLVVFDESLLKPSDRAPELVWKMEVTPTNPSEPIDELVLINAQDGKISLHFNQIDTAFTAKAVGQDPNPTDTPTPTDTPPAEPPVEVTPTPMPSDAQSQGGGDVGVLGVAYTRYVSTTGSDTGDCRNSSAPCLSIQYALNQDADGDDTIRVAVGTYIRGVGGAINTDPNVVKITKNVTLSGGWNSDFTAQTTASTIDGEYGVAGTNKNNNGILVTGGTVIVDRFVIQNSTSSDSGGIYLLASLTLTNSTVRNNYAINRGAGIFIYTGGSLTLINSTISMNTAASGGGIYNASNGAVTIQNSTIAYNTGNTGGGIKPGSGSTVIRNTILANNTAPGGGPDCYGTIGTSDRNIYGNTSGCTRTSITSDQVVNPQIDSSLTGTPPVHVLLSGSPAIDAGNPAYCPATDEQGRARPQGSACDIGAYEFPGTPGVPATIVISSGNGQQQSISQEFPNPLVAIVIDGYGTPVSGVDVTFTAPASGASVVFSSNGTSTETVTTDASGLATSSSFTANGTIGTYIISAISSEIDSPANFSLTNTGIAGIPYTISVFSGSNQQAGMGHAFVTPLKARVQDYFGNPVSGTMVTFTAPSSGASVIFAGSGTYVEDNVSTDSSGIATSSILMPNGAVGAYVVVASVSGVSSTANFSLANTNAWYVDFSRPDDNGNCSAPATACKTINGAISKATAGDTIYVAEGTYTGSGTYVVNVSKSLFLYGGWDTGFTSQTGLTVIDGQNARSVVNVTSNVTMDHFQIQNGYSFYGAGGIQNSGLLNLNNSVVMNNRTSGGASSSVGGIGSGGGGTGLILNNSTVRDNVSSAYSFRVGGIRVSGGGIFTMNNSTITGNTGIGIELSSYSGSTWPVATINNSTIANNIGGGYVSSPYYGITTVRNSIIANNTATSSPDCNGAITTSDHNIIGNTGGCVVTAGLGDRFNVNPQISTYPIGRLGYHVLSSSSPAIDAGNPATCLGTDQRDMNRPQGSACDIGAYEYSSPSSATSLEILSGSNQHTPPQTAFPKPLAVYILDDQGSPVPGVDVTFSAPVSGASGTFGSSQMSSETIQTDAFGIAVASTFTANDQLGDYTINVTASGFSDSVNFALSNLVWFVNPAGPSPSDSNTCTSPSTSCLTITGALNKAVSGDVIRVASGTYGGGVTLP